MNEKFFLTAMSLRYYANKISTPDMPKRVRGLLAGDATGTWYVVYFSDNTHQLIRISLDNKEIIYFGDIESTTDEMLQAFKTLTLYQLKG